MTLILLAGLPADILRHFKERITGATVEASASVGDLEQSIRSQRPALIILSDGFDGKRAHETFGMIRDLRLKESTRIWCCTSSTNSAEIISGMVGSGVDRIFFLPTDPEELVRETSTLLGLEIARGEPRMDNGKSSTALAAVWARFRDSTLARIDILEAAALSILENKLSPDERASAEREAHKLAGSAGTFGFPRSSRIARELEQRLSSRELTPAEAVPLSELIIALRRDLEGTPAAARESESEVQARSGRRLLLFSDDLSLSSRLAMEADGRGFKLTSTDQLSVARERVSSEEPSLVLVSLPSEGIREQLLDFVQDLEARVPCIPVIVFSGTGDFRARVEVARRGAHGFLEHPVSPARAIDAVVATFEQLSGTRATIVAVDDDPQILDAIKALLEPVRMRVETLSNPLKFWDVMEEQNPDLVLLDIDMPHVSGFELCRALRQDTRWARVPVLFVTARDDAASIQRAFSAGADDFVRKPLISAELLMRVNSRLDRARLNRELAEVDALTGIANRRKTAELLERFARLARRRGDPLSVAVLDLDNFKQVNDQFGHAAGDDVLRALAQHLSRSLRVEDIVGRWGGEEFVVGLFGTNKAEGARRIRELLASFAGVSFVDESKRSFSVTCSAGIAQFPMDGTEIDALRSVADAALYEAKASGRNKVVVAGGSSAPETARVDVAIIDDDEALSGLLSHSMESQRLSSIVFEAGDRAVEALTGEIPRVFARVILLDVDLPAINGLDVLRALSKHRVTLKSRVIMLSARSGEHDILTALQLGATDHVTKPFSLPVLMQKVRVALHESIA
ncbi:MAG: response regulator [Gemmatimonadaceae bacterium]|nr:response regulator [Gemmatimonadaceae bacterium]